MTQAYTALFTGQATPRVHAIDLSDLPLHADPDATDAQREANRVVRTWNVADLDNKRIDAFAADGDGGVYCATNDPAAPFDQTGKLWLLNLDTATARLVGNLAHRDGPIVAKAMLWFDEEMVMYGQIRGGSNFLFGVDLSTGTCTIRGGAYLDDAGTGDPTSLLEYNGNAYLLHRTNAPATKLQQIDTATGARAGDVITLSPAGIDVNGAMGDETGIHGIDNGNDRLVRLDFSTPGSVSAAPVGSGLPGEAFGMVSRPTPTFSFREDVDSNPGSSVAPGSTHEFGAGVFQGTAGGGTVHHWYELTGAGTFESTNAHRARWTAPQETGNYVLRRRSVRDGVLVTVDWSVRVVEETFSIEVFCPDEVGTGEDYEVFVETDGNFDGAPAVQWHDGTLRDHDDNGLDAAAFDDATAAGTQRTAGAPGVETSSVIVTLGAVVKRAECVTHVLAASVPGSANGPDSGSDRVSDFVLDPAAAAPGGSLLPVNDAAVADRPANRAPDIPAHPAMPGSLAVWRSHPLAFGDPMRLEFVGIDADWTDADGNPRGAVQFVLSAGERNRARMLWAAVWRNGPWHYMRGRYFTNRPDLAAADRPPWPMDEIAEGRSFAVSGVQVSSALAGAGVRQPFPDHATTAGEFASIAEWQRNCIRRRIASPSRLVVVPFRMGVESRAWSIDVVSNVPVNAIHLSDDAEEYVELRPV